MKNLKDILHNIANFLFGFGDSENDYQRVKALLDEHKLNAMKYSIRIL